MKRVFAALAIVGLSTGAALAAPGDPRVVQGTLEWPASVSTEPFVIVRGEDGTLYYADISTAQRRGPGGLTAKSRIALLGIEGGRPYELAVIAVGAGDAASLGLVPAVAMPPTPSPDAPGAPAAPAEDLWRVDGTVQAVSGATVTLRTAAGRTQTVDLSQLSDGTRRSLRPGERISVFGVPRDDRRLVANGLVQSEASPPSASPR